LDVPDPCAGVAGVWDAAVSGSIAAGGAGSDVGSELQPTTKQKDETVRTKTANWFMRVFRERYG